MLALNKSIHTLPITVVSVYFAQKRNILPQEFKINYGNIEALIYYCICLINAAKFIFSYIQ